MEKLILFCFCVSIVFLGAAIIRVGIRGRYLGSLKLVLNVRKYTVEPLWYHRSITVALGILSLLFGVGAFLEFVLSGAK